MPIYQTATFASADADELGDIAADARAGYAYSRIANPTSSALGAAYAELAAGEAGVALESATKFLSGHSGAVEQPAVGV